MGQCTFNFARHITTLSLIILAAGCGGRDNVSVSETHARTPNSQSDTSDGLLASQCRPILQRATQLVLQHENSPNPQPVILHEKDINCLAYEVSMKDHLSATGYPTPNPYQPLLAQLFAMASEQARGGGNGGGDGGGGIPGGDAGALLQNGVKIQTLGDLACPSVEVSVRRQGGRLVQIDLVCRMLPEASGSYLCTGSECRRGNNVVVLFDDSFDLTLGDGRRGGYSYSSVDVIAPIEFYATPLDDCNASTSSSLTKTLHNLTNPNLSAGVQRIDLFCQEFIREYRGGRFWCSRIAGGAMNGNDANSISDMQQMCRSMITSHAQALWSQTYP